MLWRCSLSMALFLFFGIEPCLAHKRFALVIGNGAYSPGIGPLSNPTFDADLVSDALKKVGFQVTTVKDATRSNLLRVVEEYATSLNEGGSDTIGFVYYSGHGVSRPGDGTNYLIPIDIRNLQTPTAWYEAISLEFITREIVRLAPAASHFLVFDACRTELRLPTKSSEKGFENVMVRSGTFVALATSPNQTASDVGDRGGPYAKALAREIVRAGQDHLALFQNVKEAVYLQTALAQRPWENNGLIGRVYFNGTADTKNNEPQKPIESVSVDIKGQKQKFCDDLLALTRLSPSLFSPIRKSETTKDSWSTSAILYGFNSCQISKVNSNIAFTCQGPSMLDSQAKKYFDNQIKQYQACLGPSWRQASFSAHSISLSTSFSNPEGTSIIFSMYDMLSIDDKKRTVSNLMIYNQTKQEAVNTADLPALEKPQNFCKDLQRVLDATSSKFESLSRGKIVSGQPIKPTVRLSGFSSCYIASLNDESKSRYYSCYLGPMSLPDANKINADLSNDVGQCLGNEWSLNRTSKRNGSHSYEWSKENVSESVELRSSQNSDATWDIKIDVNVAR